MAQRATSLGPKPSLFSFCFFVVFAFLFFAFLIEKPVFTPKKGAFLCIFLCLPLFLFSLFGPPPFSLSLSLSLSCSFLSSFLSVSHFCIWFLLFLFVLFAFLFQDVTLFLFFFFFFCLLSCFVLNHKISFLFPLHLVFYCCCFFVFVALVFCYFF